MSDSPELNSKLKLDVNDFKLGIATANREIRVLESGFRVTAAEMGDWTKTSEGLQARLKMLTGVLNQQVDKVYATEREYKKLAKEKGANSVAAQEMLVKLNKEKESLTKVSKELDETDDRLRNFKKESKNAGKEVEDLGKKQDKTTKSTNKLKEALDRLGKIGAGIRKALIGIGTVAVAATAALGGIALTSAQAADELVRTSDVTGLSITKLQELAYIGDQVGVSAETIQSSFARLTKSMGTAKDGSGEQAEAFKALGISITGSNGELRASQDVFNEVLGALGKVTNETERDVLAQQLLGRSAMELNPLIKTTADEMQRMADKAKASGAIMSEDAVRGLEEWGDRIDGLKNSLKGNMGTIAAGLLPALNPATTALENYINEFAEILGGSKGNLREAGPKIGELIGKMLSNGVRKLPGVLNAGLYIITGLIQGIITSLPVLVPAVLQLLQSLVNFLKQNLPILISAGIPVLMSLITGIVSMLPMLMEAAVQILMALVNGIAEQLPALIPVAVQLIVTLINGIAQALPQLLAVMGELIPKLIIALIENLPLLIEAALKLILVLVEGLGTALPILISYAPEIVTAFAGAIEAMGPVLVDMGKKILIALIDGIKSIWEEIKTTGSELINMFVDEFNREKNLVVEIGSMLVMGVWEGIQAKAEWFMGHVSGFFKRIIGTAQTVTDQHSPSRVFAKIGENLALGLGVGFEDNIEGVRQKVARSVQSLNASANVSASFASGTGMSLTGNSTRILELGGVHITINGNANPSQVKQATTQGIQAALRSRGYA